MASASSSGIDLILTDLKNQIYSPVYLLHGEESYYIDLISDFIEQHVLGELEKEFNQTIVYGKDTNVPAIISLARRFPMMANYQVVIVKEAQVVDKLEELVKYVESPLKSTILVLCYKYGSVDKRKVFFKAVEKNGIVIESPRLYDSKIPEWIHQYLKVRKYSITDKAALMLSEFLGNDLSKIVNEIQKLLISLPAGGTVSEEIVDRNICISKDFNVYELQKALGTRDVFKANMIIRYFANNQRDNPLVKIIPILSSWFHKILLYHSLPDKSRKEAVAALGINQYFLNDFQVAARNYPPGKLFQIFSLLREYDLKAKGVDNSSTSDGELMKELIFKILH